MTPTKRRRSRGRSGDDGIAVSVGDGFPAFEHNPWTPAGEIERYGALARSVKQARGPKRWFAILLGLMILFPLPIVFIVLVVDLVT